MPDYELTNLDNNKVIAFTKQEFYEILRAFESRNGKGYIPAPSEKRILERLREVW